MVKKTGFRGEDGTAEPDHRRDQLLHRKRVRQRCGSEVHALDSGYFAEIRAFEDISKE